MTRRPTSCRSAATASSSRSAQPTARPIWSAARWVARAWMRKRSGFSSQPPLDSKKSKTRRGAGDRQDAGGLEDVDRVGDAGDAARADAAAVGEAQDGDRQGDVGLDRLDQLADAGGLGGRGAHDPLAGLDQDREALDRLEGVGEAAAGRRARSSACSWPGGICALPFPFGLWAWSMPLDDSAMSSADEDVRFSHFRPQNRSIAADSIHFVAAKAAVRRSRSIAASMRASDCSRPSAASDSKMPGRDRAAGDRDPDRLVELARLDVEALGQRRQRRLDRLAGRSRRRRARASRAASSSGRDPVLHHLAPRPSRRRPGARRGSGSAARPRPASAPSPGRSRRRRAAARRRSRPRWRATAAGVLLERHLAHEAAVDPAQLLLVEDRRRPADVLDPEALDQLLGRHQRRVVVGRPSRAARGSCGPRPAGSRRRAAPAPRRRRGAWRASCRRGRAAAAGGRSAGGSCPSAASTSSCLGVLERWSSPRTTSVIPISASSTATAKL